jgi:hypothetical protein
MQAKGGVRGDRKFATQPQIESGKVFRYTTILSKYERSRFHNLIKAIAHSINLNLSLDTQGRI